jgi:hypothetical protein
VPGVADWAGVYSYELIHGFSVQPSLRARVHSRGVVGVGVFILQVPVHGRRVRRSTRSVATRGWRAASLDQSGCCSDGGADLAHAGG